MLNRLPHGAGSNPEAADLRGVSIERSQRFQLEQERLRRAFCDFADAIGYTALVLADEPIYHGTGIVRSEMEERLPLDWEREEHLGLAKDLQFALFERTRGSEALVTDLVAGARCPDGHRIALLATRADMERTRFFLPVNSGLVEGFGGTQQPLLAGWESFESAAGIAAFLESGWTRPQLKLFMTSEAFSEAQALLRDLSALPGNILNVGRPASLLSGMLAQLQLDLDAAELADGASSANLSDCERPLIISASQLSEKAPGSWEISVNLLTGPAGNTSPGQTLFVGGAREERRLVDVRRDMFGFVSFRAI